ncbi:MAG: methionyl-tRNA formyltransferase [Acholeplasmatales bacterium]|nr:methionyl-tRNA formyltransferase [Acholeplasmatales bacterium]
MKIVFMGTPEFAVPILEALNEKYEVCLAVSQPNRVKKKGVLLDTPVASKAKELGIELFQPEKISSDYQKILDMNADMLVTAAYGQYIPSKILNKFKKCINVHGSLLPLHRGGAPIQRCLINGDKKTGVTIMEMTKKLDAGRMYSFKEYEILPEDNNTLLFEKLSIIGRDLLMDSIEDIYNNVNLGIPQDEALASYSPNIAPEEEEIKLNNKAIDIVNRIRGLSYDPGAYLNVNGIKLKIFKANIVEGDSNLLPGTVICTKKKIVLKTLDKAIELLEVLMPGKKIMSGRDFSNGQKIFIEGTIIGSEN